MKPAPQCLPDPALLLITDRTQAKSPLPEICAAASRAGCRWFMIREKDLDRSELIGLVGEIRQNIDAACRIMVNGDIDAALESNADGVHVQSCDAIAQATARMADGALIGYSAHSVSDAAEAERAGADYVTLSPVFETTSKPGYGPAIGTEGITAAVKALFVPVIGLAGIRPQNAADVVAAGAAGVAVMGGIMRANEPEADITDLIAALTS